MSITFKVSVFVIVGALAGLCLGIGNALLFPQYYTVDVGALLGSQQGAIIGLIVGLICFRWNAKLKNFINSIRNSKYRTWQFITAMFFLSPFILYWPYHWFVFAYKRDAIVTPRIGLEGQQVHLGVWFFVTFGLFCILALFVGGLCLIRTLKLRNMHKLSNES